MDWTDTNTVVTVACGIAIVVGIFGTVVPYVPGVLLCWIGVLGWAIFGDGGPGKWVAFGIVTLLALLGTLLKYLLPGRRLKQQGVPNLTLFLGGALAIVGFFVVPVIGLFLGFVLGVYLGELARLKSNRLAWPATWRSIKAVGFSVMIEILAALLILVVWVAAIFLV